MCTDNNDRMFWIWFPIWNVYRIRYLFCSISSIICLGQAICCKLETSSPTTDPTKEPTSIPTAVPTTQPSRSPTPAPTFIPTLAPTPFCPNLKIEVVGTTNFNKTAFEGLYVLQPDEKSFNRPVWRIPQIPLNKYIEYIGGVWIIFAEGKESLSYTTVDRYPPYNQQTDT